MRKNALTTPIIAAHPGVDLSVAVAFPPAALIS
jgi:hypothetical protein